MGVVARAEYGSGRHREALAAARAAGRAGIRLRRNDDAGEQLVAANAGDRVSIEDPAVACLCATRWRTAQLRSEPVLSRTAD